MSSNPIHGEIFFAWTIDDYEGEKNGELFELLNDFLNLIEDFDTENEFKSSAWRNFLCLDY